MTSSYHFSHFLTRGADIVSLRHNPMGSWVDGFVALVAYAATIVATLRAGSRALYLLEHDHIGVMEGPQILGPEDAAKTTAEPSPLWNICFAFTQSVQLALAPHSMEHRVEFIAEEEPEPYSLSPYPIAAWQQQQQQEDDGPAAGKENDGHETSPKTEDSVLDDYIEEIITDSEKKHPLFRYFRMPTLLSTKSIVSSARLFPVGKWANVWRRYLKRNPYEEEEEEDDDDDEWDYDLLRWADVSFNGTETESQTARVSVYAPETFVDLRTRFGVSESQYQTSLLKSGPFVSFQSNSKGAARVGGMFFFSRDGAYMIKTIKKEEAKRFLRMLPKYHKYMRRNEHRSLLTRFCGMYSVQLYEEDSSTGKLRKGKECVFLVMNAVFPAEGTKFISQRFDLKGSTVGRECSEEEKAKKGSLAVLKDLDLAREVEIVRALENPRSRVPSEYGLHIGLSAKAALLSQLRRDVKLLVECEVMDYSLLVGVVNMDSGRLDLQSLEALIRSEMEEKKLQALSKKERARRRRTHLLVRSVTAPLRIMLAPVVFVGRKSLSSVESTLSTILTLPLPYYGSGLCGVDGGVHSVIEGRRNGHPVIYYMGLIDFLQPWTARKVLERQLKGVLGYDTHAISSVDPQEYASRFLEFVETHVS